MSRWTSIKKKVGRVQDIFAAAAFAEAGEYENARRIGQERRPDATDGTKTLRSEVLSRRPDRPTLR